MKTAIAKNDDQIALVEGLSLSRSKIYGVTYIELKGVPHQKFNELREMGLLDMCIDYRWI